MKKYKFNDWDIALDTLKQDGFIFASVRDGLIPSLGSPTKPIKYLVTNKDMKGNRVKVKIFKVINHKDGKVTIETNIGFVKFFK